jgi:negative regulator of genetic competence, sporulation and motility
MLAERAVKDMEWIRISQNKLKIMLSAEDARHYALDCEGADYADVMTREAFRDILSDVRAETGFDATEDKVYIQMYPSKEGGCELFVTKVGLLLAEGATHGTKPRIPRERETPSRGMRQRRGTLYFTELAPLLALCRRMASTFQGKSEVWQDERGGWWLLLTDHGDPFSWREDFRFTLEYGTPVAAQSIKAYLGEHGRAVCKQDAVRILGDLA